MDGEYSGEAWRNASEFRADASLLPDRDVQAVVSRLVLDGGFDDLHSERPDLDGLRGRLRDRAVEALLAHGRDVAHGRAIEDYVDRDLWARFPTHSIEYQEQVDRMARLGLRRTPEHSATLTRAVFVNNVFSFGTGTDPRAPELRGVPSRVELEVFHEFVSVLVSTYRLGTPGDRRDPPRWGGSWLMLTEEWELVALSTGALSPEVLRPDLVEPLRDLAIAFREWQTVRGREEYQVRMRLGHGGPPFIPAD